MWQICLYNKDPSSITMPPLAGLIKLGILSISHSATPTSQPAGASYNVYLHYLLAARVKEMQRLSETK